MSTVLHPEYTPDAVERWGRRLKMEYIGMGSVFLTILLRFYFIGLQSWSQSLLAMGGSFFLFLGLKKKTRDHLAASFLLFAAAAVAQGPVLEADWIVPLLLFGVIVATMEGYIEKRQERVYVLPVAFWLWGTVETTWVLGFLFVSLYLLNHWPAGSHLRRRLFWVLGLSTSLALLGSAFRADKILALLPLREAGHLALSDLQAVLLACIGIPTLLCLGAYWNRLSWPHRLNTVAFAALAPWDGRFAAFFAMVAAVLLSATAFRQSVDSATLRPVLKHAEWHFFWGVLFVAIWAILSR
ncbi:MAG: hypothetical protein ACE5HD_11885 [Acidobacteriota bacterium]